MSDIRDQTHLGDGAYAGHDGYQLWLGANHHCNMTVALDPRAMLNLLKYINKEFPHVVKKFMQTQVMQDEG
jgi:hypothetical protein